jgi:hypothetical protein
MKRLSLRDRDEQGVIAVVVAVCIVALIGATVMAVDSGSAWKTKRDLITDTDAAALAAARMFAMGFADPCTQTGRDVAEAEALRVLLQNNPNARHDAASTPNGFEVTPGGTCPPPVGQITPGHVRFDGRQLSKASFAGIFNSGGVDAISVSIAQWGYVTQIAPQGLRPIAVCDQSRWPYTAPPTLPPSGGAPYPHYALWDQLQKGLITQSQYDTFFGAAPEYPTKGYHGETYLSPAQGGGVVHFINAKDTCGGGSSWRGWVDLDGKSNGTPDLAAWLLNGFEGVVSLGGSSPRDCNNDEPTKDCEATPGNHNADGVRGPLDTITCAASTPSKDCFVFPLVLDNGVVGTGSNALIQETGFLWVILRGWGGNGNKPCEGGNDGCEFHFEFVKIQTQGAIGFHPPGSTTTAVGSSLCGIDHDSVENRCNV